MMKRILSVALSLLFALNLMMWCAPKTQALDSASYNGETDIFTVDGILSYFKSTNEYTVNATLNDEVILFSFAYRDRFQVFEMEIPITDLGLTREDLNTISNWNAVFDVAIKSIPSLDDILSSSDDISLRPIPDAMINDTDADLLAELRSLYGSPYNHQVGYGQYSGYWVTVRESLEFRIEFAGQGVSIGGKTLQAAASLIGIRWPVLGTLLGLAADALVPANTSVNLYDCMAYLGRMGDINGTTYYADTHTRIHRAFDVINEPNDVKMDLEPYIDYYYDSEDNFSGVQTIIRNTVEAYLT